MNKPGSAGMDDIQNSIVEDFGIGYVKFGHSELMGRLVGLLMCEAGPISIDEICKALKVTKTPVNQICRRLEELKLIRRIRVSGERKYHYQISADVFLQAGVNLSRLFEDNVHMAENNLQPLLSKYLEATGSEKARLKLICERLIVMREFHARELESYKNFIEEWKHEKALLTSVEDYLRKIGIAAGLRVTTVEN